MALRTLGSNANNSLSAFLVGKDNFGTTGAANLALLNLGILGDPPGYNALVNTATTGLVTGTGTVRPRINQPFASNGILIVPNRGWLQCKPGDFVCFDATTGWPILLSGDAAANGPYTHT